MTALEYRQQLQALLPQGHAWSRAPDAILTCILDAGAVLLAGADFRSGQLAAELDPRTAVELLIDWERVVGLPDPYFSEDVSTLTLIERQFDVHAKLTMIGGQSDAYFTSIAPRLGYEITIGEYTPHTVEKTVNTPIYGEDWAFVWSVKSAEVTIIESTVGSAVSDPIRKWGNERLENWIRRYKPAHTYVIFKYGD